MLRQLVILLISNMMYNSTRTQNIKEGAYLDYFKYFSVSVLETTRKLSATFNQQFNEQLLFDSTHMFKVIKKLLNAYEVLILEINDSCEFVEIPEFGVCLVKIYFQLMSVIKYLVNGFVKKGPPERPQKQKRLEQRHTMIIPSPDANSDISEAIERESIRLRQNASHIFKDLTAQVKTLEKEQRISIKESQDALEKINENRQKLQTIESSQSQNVLNEAVAILFRRGEHINNFLNLLQSGQNQLKEQPQTFSKLKEKIDEDNFKRIFIAKSKLSELFTNHIIEYQKQRRESMVSEQIQVNMDEVEIDDMVRKRKSAHRKTHIDQVKKLKTELNNLEEENIALREYIRTKIEEHQNATTVIVAEKIKLQSKLSAVMNEKKSQTFTSKGSINIKPSITNIDICDSVQNIQNSPQIKSHLSIDMDTKDCDGNQVRNTFKQSRVKIPKHARSRVKFSPSTTNRKLRHQSKQFQFTHFSNKVEEFEVKPQTQDYEIKIIEEDNASNAILEQSQQNEESIKCQDALFNTDKSNEIVLLKITNPLLKNTSSEIDEWKDNEICEFFKKQTNIRVKKTQNKIPSQASRDSKSRKVTKKQSVITFIQDSQPKKVSDFSQASGFKPDPSKENVNPLEKDGQKSKEIKRSYRFYQMDSNLSESSQKWLETELSQDFTQVALRPLKYSIQFKEEDLIQIFFSIENAKNYEILNLSLASKQKKYLTAQGSKSGLKTLKKSKSKIDQPLSSESNGNNNPSPADSLTLLIGVVFEALNFVRKDKPNYKLIVNFLRYPYSSIFNANTKGWKTLQGEEEVMEYFELRKLLTRLSKLHSECPETLCIHWRYLLSRIGIEFH